MNDTNTFTDNARRVIVNGNTFIFDQDRFGKNETLNGEPITAKELRERLGLRLSQCPYCALRLTDLHNLIAAGQAARGIAVRAGFEFGNVEWFDPHKGWTKII